MPFKFSFSRKYVDNILVNFFRERKTPSENIAFIGLFSAVNAVFAVLLAFVPFSDLFAVLFLPLASAFVGLLCDKRYLFPYLFASIGVSLASTAYNMQTTFFYVIPAICAGTLYGFLYQKKWPLPYVVLGTALLEMGLNYLSIPLIHAIYGSDIIAFFLKVLSLDQHPYVHDIIPAFLFAYSLAQTAISHFAIQGFFSRFHLAQNENEKLDISFPLVGICGVIACLSFMFFSPATSYFFLVFTIYFTAFSCLLFRYKFFWWVYLILGLLILGSFYLFAFAFASIPNDGGLALLSCFFFSLDSAVLLGRLLLLRKGKTGVK